MSLAAKTKLLVLATVAGLSLAAPLFAAWSDQTPLVFESRESKTHELKPVFNRVTFLPGIDEDLWIMQQSHDGLPEDPKSWNEKDRIAIRVEHGPAGRARVEFRQLQPGPPAAAGFKDPIGFRAPCGMCHNNGTRALRPRFDSAAAAVSAWDRWRTFAWNLRIKLYGRVEVSRSPSEKLGEVPFRFQGAEANTPLHVKACVACHKETGYPARGTLTRQNALSIRFLVEQGLMPPFGLPLDPVDRESLRRFVSGAE